MIKYFCDKCGKQTNENYRVTFFAKIFDSIGNQSHSTTANHIDCCKECFSMLKSCIEKDNRKDI